MHAQGADLGHTWRRRSGEILDEKLRALVEVAQEVVDVDFRELLGPVPANESAARLHPYPGRLLRHIPRFLLGCELLNPDGQSVLDPFCGAGTVPYEALSAGYSAIGLDVNPLAVLISAVKTRRWDVPTVRTAVAAVVVSAKKARSDVSPPRGLEYWYATRVLTALARLWAAIDQHSDPSVVPVLHLIFSLTSEQVAHKDPRLPVPVRPKGEAAYQHSIQVYDVFVAQADRTLARLGEIGRQLGGRAATIRLADVRDPSSFEERVGLVVTSPPYGTAQKYLRSSSLTISWISNRPINQLADMGKAFIGRERHVDKRRAELDADAKLRTALENLEQANPERAHLYATYFSEMQTALSRVIEVLEPGGHFCLVASENSVGGQIVETHRHLADMLLGRGLTHVVTLRDKIRGRVLLTKRAATAGHPISHEYIHILRKPA